MSVPSTPNIKVRPKATNQSLEFFWLQNAPDGGSPITSYVLFDGTTSNILNDGWGYQRVSGLSNGTSYSYSLAASNANGLSPYAYFRTVQPGTKPQVPSSITVSSLAGTTNYLVSWFTPSNIGSTTNILGTVLKGYVLDSNSNVLLRGPSTITAQIQGGNAGAFQQYTMGLYSNYVWRVLVRPVNDPGYGPNTAYSAIIDLQTPTPFSPSSFVGMQLWLDAADRTTYSTNSTSNVVRWNSKGPISIILSSIAGFGSASYPWLVGSTIAGNSTLTFNTSGYTLLKQGTTYDGVKNFFWVGQQGSFTGYLNLLGHDSVLDWQSAVSPYSYAGYTGADNTVRFASSILYANNSNFISTLGGQPVASTNTTFLLDAYNFYSSTRWQGITYDRAFGGRGWNGNLGEVIMYTSNLTPNQRLTVEGYLAWKWGISTLLPSYHPFYTRKPLGSDSNLDFSPSSIANMNLWLDAADTTSLTISSTNIVTAILDKSGNGNNSSNVSGTIITSSLNGVQTMYFNNSYLLGPLNTSLTSRNFHYIGVSRVVNSGNSGRLLSLSRAGINDSNQPDTFEIQSLTSVSLTRNGTSFGTGIAYNTNNVVNISQNSNQIFAGLNAQNISSFTNGLISSVNVNVWGLATNAGVPSDASSRLTGQIGETLFYGSTLNGLQQVQAEGYLAWKWGLQASLPSTHFYYFRPPTRKDTYLTFSPSSIRNLTYWVDASDISTISTNVSGVVQTWLDKSGSNNHTLFLTNRPTYVSTGGTFVDTANGNQQFLAPSTCYARASGESATIFITYASKGTGSTYQHLLGNTGSPYTENFYIALDRPDGEAWYSLGRTNGARTFTSTLSTIVYATRYTFGSSAGTLNINGSNVLSSFTLTVSPSGNLRFSSSGGADFGNFKFNEVLVYKSTLTTVERQQVEGYLAWKWNLQNSFLLTHPFRFFSTIVLGPISTVNTL
jgi:hypothetical protein